MPPTIATEADLTKWLALQLPNLSEAQIQSILDENPNSADTDPQGPRFETNGVEGATALEVSQDANGQQQRAANILAESTFVCPSYWMADAWSGEGKKSWHFQYSVPFASHQADVGAYFGPVPENIGADMSLAFRRKFLRALQRGVHRCTQKLITCRYLGQLHHERRPLHIERDSQRSSISGTRGPQRGFVVASVGARQPAADEPEPDGRRAVRVHEPVGHCCDAV